MSEAEWRKRLEVVLSAHCMVPRLVDGAKTIAVECDPQAYTQLVKYWSSLGASDRPRLRGITISRPDGVSCFLNIFFELAAGAPILHLGVNWSVGTPIPRLSEIWPYGIWWEEEIRQFEGVEVSGQQKGLEVRWRQL